jgi:hypothetical protein
MEYAPNEGANWRVEITDWLRQTLDHDSFNPNTESDILLKRLLPGGNFRTLKVQDPRKFIEIVRQIVELDSKEVALRADYVICFWDESAQKGAGTKGELTLARYFGKPVYVVTDLGLVDIPGWVLGCANEFFASFDELKMFLVKKYRAPRRKRNS